MDRCRLVFTCTTLLLANITVQAQEDDSLFFQFEPDSLNLCGSHHVQFLWTSHVNHHSNEQLDFATALRQSWARKQLD